MKINLSFDKYLQLFSNLNVHERYGLILAAILVLAVFLRIYQRRRNRKGKEAVSAGPDTESPCKTKKFFWLKLGRKEKTGKLLPEGENAPASRPKRLLGATILGCVNLFVFGLIPCGGLIFVYFKTDSELASMLQTMLLDTLNLELTEVQFKQAVLTQAMLSLPFVLSGIGLLSGKEWARKFTVICAFIIALLIAASIFFNPALIKEGILQIIYPGILIFYLTNKNVTEYFKQIISRK